MVSIRQYYPLFLSLVISLGASPGLAQEANFGELAVARGFDRAKATVMGTTGGAIQLADLAAQRGGNAVPPACQATDIYTSETPDHILTVDPSIETLRLAVNNGGKPTIVMVQDPNGAIYCSAIGRGFNEDAVLQGLDWTAGDYHVWVGSDVPGRQYRLSARE
ncbi:hypothetical protein PN441_02850 [Spirulina major CS-329]|uniref:hypothetical protein n=1 Tax=Spirulina TaxID=1154 RepID=UPI00232B621A|nr:MULTISPECIES: hypothetical protein [Spirulina]MDB9495727.1 hypothetical protein [Spirulina subsalsa CS-330]MDB9501995.1 hypothetical protein [Spirulina major CS-329]